MLISACKVDKERKGRRDRERERHRERLHGMGKCQDPTLGQEAPLRREEGARGALWTWGLGIDSYLAVIWQ